MIDIKNLQIGNKVKYKDSIVEITATHLTGYVGILGAFQSMIVSVKCEEIEPIEVTKEMLGKIGFKLQQPVFEGEEVYESIINGCFVDVDSFYSVERGIGWSCHIDNIAHSTIGYFDFHYLHELQNGIRLITKKDLEICL